MERCKACGTVGDHACSADVAREFEYTCEYCGEPCDELITVDDSDPSVGYRDTLEVCAVCIKRKKAPCGSGNLNVDSDSLPDPIFDEDRYAAKVDREYLDWKESF